MAKEYNNAPNQPVLAPSKPVEAPEPAKATKSAPSFKVGEMVLVDRKTNEGGSVRVPLLIAGIRQVSQGRKDENGEQLYEEKLVKMGKGKDDEIKRFPVVDLIDRYDGKLFHPNYADVQTVRDLSLADLIKI